MGMFKNKKDRNLLILMSCVLILLCCIEVGFGLPKYLVGTSLGDLLTNSSFKNILSGLSQSIIAAYIFYLFIDFMPRAITERDTRAVLDSLLAAILDAYARCRIFGHETPISHVDQSVLTESWLSDNRVLLKEQKVNFLPLKFAMQTADSRLEDFRHALPLAVSLSPKDALQWLVIVDKVRLLAENYDSQPELTEDQVHLVDTDSDDNPLKLYKSDLNLRLLELVEQTIKWRGYTTHENG